VCEEKIKINRDDTIRNEQQEAGKMKRFYITNNRMSHL
jgi:hypothetical protein